MSHQEELEYWTAEVSTAFASLSRPQAEVLAGYSLGMALTGRAGQTIISTFLGLLLGQQIGSELAPIQWRKS